MSNIKDNKLKLFIILFLIVVLLLSSYVAYKIIIFIKDPFKFKEWIISYGIYAPLIYCFITLLQILIPIIPGEPMEMVAGYAFSKTLGTFYCLLAESIGSIIVVLLVRKLGRKIIEIFFEKEKIDSLNIIKDSKTKELLFTILFLMPGTPKDLLCYFIGLTNIDLKLSFFIVTLCRIPSIITSTLLGDNLSNKDYKGSIIIFIITAILSITGVLIFNRIKKKTNQ